MKKLVTIVFFLWAFNSVSAETTGMPGIPIVPRQGVVTIFSPVLHSDSTTVLVNFTDRYYQTETLKPAYIANHADSIKILTALYSMASPGLNEALELYYVPGVSPVL